MAGTSGNHPSVDLFRRIKWQAAIPLDIRLADGEPGAGSSCDRYYTTAPPHTYLSLLLPEIRENLVELALDDEQLATVDEANWWFEEDTVAPDAPETSLDAQRRFASQGPCRWHWPLELIAAHSTIAYPGTPASLDGRAPQVRPHKPLKLLLHLSNPPNDKLLTSNTAEACRAQFLNSLKEADFVRWRNTSRVTGLRKADLDAGWEGILHDDYDAYMRMASRLMPLPIPLAALPAPSPIPSRPQSTEPTSTGKAESSYTVRALPIKMYLPDGAPVVQEVIPPLDSSGKPFTVLRLLQTHLPLLFPKNSSETEPYGLAFPLSQGIELPPDAELAWLSSCMCGADGWLRIAIQLRAA